MNKGRKMQNIRENFNKEIRNFKKEINRNLGNKKLNLQNIFFNNNGTYFLFSYLWNFHQN